MCARHFFQLASGQELSLDGREALPDGLWERERFGNEVPRRLENFVVGLRHPEPRGHALLTQTEATSKSPEVPGHPPPCPPSERRGILPLLFQVRPSLGPGCNRGFFVCKVYFYLDKAAIREDMNPRLYTTREVARRAGVSRQTLQSWIAEEKVKAPAVLRAAGVRLWTASDLAEVLKVKPRNYPRKRKRKERE